MAPVTFTSSKSWLITLVIWGTSLLLVFVFVQDMLTGSSVVGSITKGVFLFLTIGFLLWTWFGTYYLVAGNHLSYRCGPLHSRIPIQDIRNSMNGCGLAYGRRWALMAWWCISASGTRFTFRRVGSRSLLRG
nr:PH domain-containing protein [Rufibacter sp. LB8]